MAMHKYLYGNRVKKTRKLYAEEIENINIGWLGKFVIPENKAEDGVYIEAYLEFAPNIRRHLIFTEEEYRAGLTKQFTPLNTGKT